MKQFVELSGIMEVSKLIAKGMGPDQIYCTNADSITNSTSFGYKLTTIRTIDELEGREIFEPGAQFFIVKDDEEDDDEF